jgi:hypothetical protein
LLLAEELKQLFRFREEQTANFSPSSSPYIVMANQEVSQLFSCSSKKFKWQESEQNSRIAINSRLVSASPHTAGSLLSLLSLNRPERAHKPKFFRLF